MHRKCTGNKLVNLVFASAKESMPYWAFVCHYSCYGATGSNMYLYLVFMSDFVGYFHASACIYIQSMILLRQISLFLSYADILSKRMHMSSGSGLTLHRVS